jgi:hypothetical protein
MVSVSPDVDREGKANSDALRSELTRFIFARRGQWSERFFEYLIF